MKSLGFLFCFVFICACGDKKYEDYDESDFYEVTGVITTIGINKSSFSQGSRTRITYDYFVNDSTYYSGYDNSVQISSMYAGIGGPIIIKVLKEDPSISFYSRGGISKEITRERAKVIYHHIIDIYNKRVRKRNQLRKEFGITFKEFYFNDSLKIE